jgi:hypothetical protein
MRPPALQPLRIWGRVEGDLVERDPAGAGFSRCDTLDAFFCLRGDGSRGFELRLSRDEAETDLFLTAEENGRVLEAEIARLKR